MNLIWKISLCKKKFWNLKIILKGELNFKKVSLYITRWLGALVRDFLNGNLCTVDLFYTRNFVYKTWDKDGEDLLEKESWWWEGSGMIRKDRKRGGNEREAERKNAHNFCLMYL